MDYTVKKPADASGGRPACQHGYDAVGSNGANERSTYTVELMDNEVPEELCFLSHYGLPEPVFDSDAMQVTP